MNNEELLLEMKSLKKSLFINRILSIVSSVFSLVMIVVLIIGISRVNAFIKQVQVVADQVAQIDVDQVNVKATTEEGLGFTGSGEGISSQAIALLQTVENYSYVVGADEDKCAGCGGCQRNK